MPAFPRRQPPRDTNRAGESYAATLLSTLLDHGWDAASGVVDDALIRTAAQRASAAAALELDRVDFGFPSDAEIDAALAGRRLGCRHRLNAVDPIAAAHARIGLTTSPWTLVSRR